MIEEEEVQGGWGVYRPSSSRAPVSGSLCYPMEGFSPHVSLAVVFEDDSVLTEINVFSAALGACV